jgi:prepilin-type N-terminal cleavage/methylation domain-containing protein
MKFKPTAQTRCAATRKSQAGFTLAEALAALALMAIVLPAAMQGLQLASLGGQVSHRKAIATRLAESLLNEKIVTSQWNSSSQSGMLVNDGQSFNWTLRSEPWTRDSMRLVSMTVVYTVQGRDYNVVLSTLANPNNP